MFFRRPDERDRPHVASGASFLGLHPGEEGIDHDGRPYDRDVRRRRAA